ncbi:hypothetical protein [Mariprofundus sp. KV]|uniref:hypothetical protein n=1 Tax=Mariprofundus sp. KV TaxID=2608715 RepID=UPI0015A4590C|nr:hypothetical protein [Mariprofundus sp. KV]NWF36918.1 hypothetical protein [Mariprofundus sp. KV]
MAYSSTWKSTGIYRIFSGLVSGSEILKSNLELYNDVRFNSARYIINDFAEISGHSIEASDLQAFASMDEMIAQEKHEFKIALVVPQAAYVGLANGLCELTNNKLFEYATFQTVDDALKWVNSKA